MSFRSAAINITFYAALAAFFAFLSAKVHSWKENHIAAWALYLLTLMFILILLQSAERLAFPVQTALRSRALNIKFDRRISAISVNVVRAMFVAAISAFAYDFVTSRGHRRGMANALITSGFLLSLFTHDLLGHKPTADDFEHSPPLIDLKPLQSEHWGATHSS